MTISVLASGMVPERCRELLAEVVHDVVGVAARAEWQTVDRSWSAHVRLRGETGLESHVLTSLEWQEVRFDEPRCSVFITTTTDENDVRDVLAKLARAAVEYLAGGGHVEEKRGLLGTQTILVLHTGDGEWRIGKRSAQHPV